MAKPLHLIALGSGEAAGAGAGNKAALLDRARRAGLPVPPGYVLLAEAEARLPFVPQFRKKIAVRSAFSAEDHPWDELAGFFLSRLWVDPSDTASLDRALRDVWESASRRPGEFRRDILLLEMVESLRAGAAYTEAEFEDDLARWTRGTGERLQAGLTAGETLEMPKLRPAEPSALSKEAPLFAERLQNLLREIRHVFGPHDWEIEWADDGRTCWLLQIRPINWPPRRNETFTLAGHRERLPELPSTFMTAIIASCSQKVAEFFRRFDATLAGDRRFIEIFEGRPLMNLSLLFDSLRTLGLPTRLVSDNFGAGGLREFPFNPRRALGRWPALVRLGLAQVSSVREAHWNARMAARYAEKQPESFGEAAESVREVYTLLATGTLGLMAALSVPVMLLRRWDVLEEWSRRRPSRASRLYFDLISEEPGDLLARYGHRAVLESDISLPRFHEQPDLLMAAHGTGKLCPSAETPKSQLITSAPIAWQMTRLLNARDALQDEAMRAFDRLRQALLKLAARAGLAPQVLWMLDDVEVERLDSGWRPSATQIADRRAEIRRLARCRAPDVVRRDDDASRWYEAPERVEGAAFLNGTGLSQAEVEGRAWAPESPAFLLPEGWEPSRTILIVRSLHLGWMPALHRVAGVAVEAGGDLSEGAIILREIGLPAVIGVSQVTRHFRTGDAVRLRASAGLIERRSEAPGQDAAAPAFRPA